MNVNLTISLPASIASRIETDRGDLPRSKFITKLLERAYSQEPQEEVQ